MVSRAWERTWRTTWYPVSEQRFSRSMSKPVSGAGDEDTSGLVGVRRRIAEVCSFRGFNGTCAIGRCGSHTGPRDEADSLLQQIFDGRWTSRALFERILVWFVELITHMACVPLPIANGIIFIQMPNGAQTFAYLSNFVLEWSNSPQSAELRPGGIHQSAKAHWSRAREASARLQPPSPTAR